VILSRAIDQDDVGLSELLLVDVAGFAQLLAGDLVPTAELLAHLHQLEDRPWNEWGRSSKPMTPHALADQLRKFKVKPAHDRLGEVTIRGYRKADLLRAARPYISLPAPSEHFQTGTSGTAVTDNDLEHTQSGTRVPLGEPSNSMQDNAVPLVPLQEHQYDADIEYCPCGNPDAIRWDGQLWCPRCNMMGYVRAVKARQAA
jgi:uncharacterized protein DUF3631